MPEPGAGFRVFIDFDNTITSGDVLDAIIERFAGDDSWRVLEEDWSAGRIGTRDCLDGQMRALRATRADLERHLAGVGFDPGFSDLHSLLRREGVEMTVVSDNFDLIVAPILSRLGYSDIPLFANHLEWDSGSLVPSFPFSNPDCPDCAHCKKTHFMPPNRDSRRVIYVGDGRSDICPARHADIVFAKDSLLSYLRRSGIACVAYAGLADVTQSLSELFHEKRI